MRAPSALPHPECVCSGRRLKEAKGEEEAERTWKACGLALSQFASSMPDPMTPEQLKADAKKHGLAFLAAA